jgi:DNA-binding response OmpR family regulator
MEHLTKILLVEDHIDCAEALADLLELRAGFKIFVAFDQKMAVRLLWQEGPFDLVITDFGLEDAGDKYAGGDDLIAEIRIGGTFDGTKGTPPDVPIILLSGAFLDPDLYPELCRRFRTEYLFSKPVSLDALLAAIDEISRSAWSAPVKAHNTALNRTADAAG